MPLNVRYVGDVAVLSNVARSMNDPRYADAGREVDAVLDEGVRKFVLELRGIRDTGSTLLGVLTTMTRRVRAAGGELVLADVARNVREYIEEMRMDDYWDVHPDVDSAVRSLAERKIKGRPAPDIDEPRRDS